jgi:hypothetical protein
MISFVEISSLFKVIKRNKLRAVSHVCAIPLRELRLGETVRYGHTLSNNPGRGNAPDGWAAKTAALENENPVGPGIET